MLIRKLLGLFLFIGLPSLAFGQGARYDNIAFRFTPSGVMSASGASIQVCTATAPGCPALAQIFSDAAMTVPLNNPFTADNLGNFGFYAASGATYRIVISGTSLNMYILTWVAPMVSGGAGSFSSLNLTGPLTSTVATGMAPFSIASTTVVPNLNAQLHGGLSAPASAILGLTDTQSPTNKTLNVGSNSIVQTTPSAGKYLRDNGTSFQPSSVAAAGAGACGAHQWSSTLADNAAPTCTQPGFADITGTASTSQIGTGTPAASKYVDGATGAWTALPVGGVSEATLTWPFNAAAGGSICSAGSATPLCVFYILANAHTITRVVTNSSSAESGCTTFAQFGIRDITGGTLLASVTLGATGITDSGALSVATIAGHQFAIGQVVADAGCTTHATVMSLTVTYQ